MNGLYLSEPHGRYIYDRVKSQIVTDKPRPITGPHIICSKDHDTSLAYGVATIGNPATVDIIAFDNKYGEHYVHKHDRLRWWPDAKQLYLYPVERFDPYDTPREIDVQPGVQMLMGEVKEKQAMPWKSFRVDSEWCVYKLDEAGERTGDSRGCHPTKKEADAQVRALFAAEAREQEKVLNDGDKGTAEDNKLPDSAFLYVEPGDKDDTGRTIPRSKRHLPYRKADGSIDLPRLRNALSRLGQPKTGTGEDGWLTASLRKRLITKAQGILKKAQKDVEEVIAEFAKVGDMGDHEIATCTCPECDSTADKDADAPCDEQVCPKCNAKMGRESDKQLSEGSLCEGEVIGLTPADLEAILPEGSTLRDVITTGHKAGRRINKNRLGGLRKLKEQFEGFLKDLSDFISWGAHEDEQVIVPSMFKAGTMHSIKAADGRHWLVLWPTNAYFDREDEVFTRKAIQEAIDSRASADTKGTVRFIHAPGSDFATIHHEAFVADRFMVQLATYDDTPVGDAFKAFFDKYPDSHPAIAQSGWAQSHGYLFKQHDRQDGIYNWFDTDETTVLPHELAANQHNPRPILGGTKMDEKQMAAFRAVGDEFWPEGGEAFIAHINTTGEQLRKEKDDIVEHKDITDAAKVRELAQSIGDESLREKLLAAVKDDGGEDVGKVEATPDTPAEVPPAPLTEPAKVSDIANEIIDFLQLKALSDDQAIIKEAIKTLTGEVASLREDEEKRVADVVQTLPRFDWMRASQADETVLSEQDVKELQAAVAKRVPTAIQGLASQING